MKKALLYLLLGSVSFANAQYNPEIFANLYTGNDQYQGVKSLTFSAKLNNLLFFNITEANDAKLYVTDGSVGNTIVLKSVPHVLTLGVFDNHVYFSFKDPVNGAELWKTDGTVSGTARVSILGGTIVPYFEFVIASNKLFFIASNSANPTVNQVYSLQAGSNTPTLFRPDLFNVIDVVEYNGNVVFTANNSTTISYANREPYISDGTTAGTTMIKDINPGTDGSSSRGFIKYDNKLFFNSEDGTHGNEIWFTDGTEIGTQLLKDINPGSANGTYLLQSGVFDGKLYFTADDGIHGYEVWSTDGTPNGTQLFKDINLTGGSNPNTYVSFNDKLLIGADNGINGYELWVSDGTPQNTNLLLDINPGPDTGFYTINKSSAICTDQLFFSADNGGFNMEPWVTDGTVAGTHIVEDLNPAGASQDYSETYIHFDNRIFFSANTGSGGQLFVMESCANLGVETNPVTAFTIYPNPTKNLINIDTTSEIEKIDIYNSLGQRVNSVVGNKKEVDVSTLSNGIYFLTITTTDQFQTVQRIIKE